MKKKKKKNLNNSRKQETCNAGASIKIKKRRYKDMEDTKIDKNISWVMSYVMCA